MRNLKRFAKISGATIFLISAIFMSSCATDPGSLEATNSASRNCRNIIGVEISNLTDKQRAETPYKGEGVYVTAVIHEHSGRATGLKAGDIITKINSMPVREVSEALMAIDGLEAGKKYPFRIYRSTAKPGLKYFTANILIEEVQERAIGRTS